MGDKSNMSLEYLVLCWLLKGGTALQGNKFVNVNRNDSGTAVEHQAPEKKRRREKVLTIWYKNLTSPVCMDNTYKKKEFDHI